MPVVPLSPLMSSPAEEYEPSLMWLPSPQVHTLAFPCLSVQLGEGSVTSQPGGPNRDGEEVTQSEGRDEAPPLGNL